MPKKKIVSIVGTGVIGAGWAARFLANGYIVKAYDPNKQSLDQLKINVKTAFKSLRKVGLNKNASLSNLKTYTDLSKSLEKTTFIQESAPENEKIKKEILKQIPLSRFGKPREVAELIEFLISDEASYITGQTIHINGGLYM